MSTPEQDAAAAAEAAALKALQDSVRAKRSRAPKAEEEEKAPEKEKGK